MPRTANQRAQQFLAYDALKGFQEMLREKEKVLLSEEELSEDDYEELNEKAQSMKPGDMITVLYSSGNQYIRLTGILSKICLEEGYLQIVKERITLKSIRHLEIEKKSSR